MDMFKQGKLYKIIEGGLSEAKSKPVPVGGQPFYSEGFVVEFYKKDGTSWIGNFYRYGAGAGVDAVYEYPEKNKVIVSAGGRLYVMNPNSSEPLEESGYRYDRVLGDSNKQVVMYDYTRILIIESDGEIWISDEISLDGFKDLKIENNILAGLSYDYMDKNQEWVPFSLNLATKEIVGGTGKKYDSLIAKRAKKPWWKIF